MCPPLAQLWDTMSHIVSSSGYPMLKTKIDLWHRTCYSQSVSSGTGRPVKGLSNGAKGTQTRETTVETF